MKGEAVYRRALQGFVGVEVFPRGFDVAVAHEFLDRHDIAAALEQSRRVGVAEFVERGIGNFGGGADLFEPTQEVRLPGENRRGVRVAVFWWRV